VRAELDKILESTPNGCPCFVYGPLGANLAGAQGVADLAAERRLPLLNGTPLPVTWRLPEVDLEMGTPLSEALIVVQGPEGWAELHALDGLLPVIERRRNGESGVRAIHALRGDAVWQASENGLWSPALLAAAISRSNSPQGDPVKDGRTQDLAGLGLVPKLARAPRGWILDHADGLRSTLLVLDGVVADFNFAVRTRAGEIVSAQLYRPPAPPDHQFSRLAEVIEEFFRKGHPPWPIDRSRLESGLLGRFRELGGQRGQSKPISTPELQIAYAIP
jgi:hypothetical protein